MHIHWKGVGAAMLTALGLVSSPTVMHLMPAQWSSVLMGIGIIAQAFTHKAVAAAPPAEVAA